MGSLVEKYGWHEWLCHTNFSFLQGASFPHEYVERAYHLGYAGIGITDMDGVYGIVRAFRHRHRMQISADFKLTYGAEIHLCQDHDLPLFLQETVVLKALTHRGYHNLCRILTYAHRHGKHDAYVEVDHLLTEKIDDLVAIMPMRGLVGLQDPQKIYVRCARFKEIFGSNLYIALGKFLNPAEDHWAGEIHRVAQSLGISCLLSQDPFMHHPNQKPVADVLQAIARNRPLDECMPFLWVNDQHSLQPLAALERRYGRWPCFEQALQASRSLREKFTFDLDQLRYRYPQEMIPTGLSADDFLAKSVWEAAHETYRGEIPVKIRETLTKELHLVRALKFADYFLTVWDIVHWARSRNILCQGRGSAANSTICYVLGVTSVDPNVFDLLPERFISMERGDPPDIDVDFEHERREEVIQFIYERYGRRRAAMVANVISFQSRGALRFVGQALGVDSQVLGTVAKLMRQRQYRRNGARCVLEQAALEHPNEVIPWRLWGEMADRVLGFPRHLGLHCGGFLITDRALDWFVPQEPATMPNRTVITWCKEDVEALGFFKIDVLSLGMLTAIRKCFSYIKDFYGVSYSLADLPLDDQATYAMLQRADTVGTFQVESRAQMAMLPRLQPKTFYDLAIEVGIVRPGPLQGGFVHPYLNRRMGLEPVDYAHPDLQPILKRTLGIPIFQEQIMRIAIAVGGFSPGEADELRRQMGAWQFRGDLAPLVTRLAEGMRQHGIAERFIQQLLKQVRGFAEYGFPESHAISFALIAYASCYLRCHYLPAFVTAILNSQPMGFYTPHALIQDARRHGVAILPICIQRSDWDHRLEAVDHHDKNKWGIRLGMRLVAGLREASAREIIRRRQSGWDSWQDFLQSLCENGKPVTVNRRDVSCLAAANAFAAFGFNRRQALWQGAAWPIDSWLPVNDEPAAFPDESAWEAMRSDFAAYQTTMADHPATLVRQKYWSYPVDVHKVVLAENLGKKTHGEQVCVFGLIIIRQSPPSAKGMVFITLEDETGFLNLVVTPDVYQRTSDLLNEQGFVCVRGQLQTIAHGHSVLVKEVFVADAPQAEVVDIEGQKEMTSSKSDELTRVRNYQ